MPKWKKDAKEFTVSVNHNEVRGYQSSIPKPVMEALGEPRTLKFVINGNNVKIESGGFSDKINMRLTTDTSNKRKGVK